jgi:ribosome-binding protein aMBF1 (putative translation factor)
VVTLAILSGAVALASVLVYRWLRPQVTVTRVVEGPVVQAFYATGTLLPEREYPIKANAAGYLAQVLVDKGDSVTKDQPLGFVSEDSVQYKFDQAQAEREEKTKLADEKTSPVLRELDARQAASTELLEIARREQQRVNAAVERNAASQSDLDKTLDRVKTLAAEIEQIKAQRATKRLELAKNLQIADAALKIAQWNLDRQTIRSPIDHGAVLDRPVSVGTRLAVNDHIMQVADVRPENLVMRSAVDEEDITQVKRGQIVHMTLYAFPGQTFSGTVKKIYDKADPERRTFEVDVAMDEKNPAFAAGMTGELAFVVAHKDRANVVPTQAVQAGNIWVVRNQQLLQLTPQIGLRSVERTEILSGLQPDDLIVISPAAGLTEGRRPATEFIDPLVAANLNKPKEESSSFKGFR